MNETSVVGVHSRDNPLVKDLRRLAQDSTAYRKQARFWVEGDHLCRAALVRGWSPAIAVFAESYWPTVPPEWRRAPRVVVVPDALFRDISGLESPARMGYVLDMRTPGALVRDAPTLVLDRVQDAGNVGSMLRSAAAFGFRQVLALQGTAALWSPKVLRAGMGAHFGLSLLESITPGALAALQVPLLVTSSHGGDWVHAARLPWPCAWVMGHEGQGVSEALMARAHQRIRIAQPGGEESLNVAAAAAICLYASVAGRS